MRKNPIVKVSYNYVGTAAEFKIFLEALIRSYLASGYSDVKVEGGFMDKVEKEV